MITVVTAPSRSGTSLTMQMLNAAGIPLVWNLLPNRTAINPRGHFELTGDSITTMLPHAVAGSAVKVMPWHLDLLPPQSYQYIVLLRDSASLRASHAYAEEVHRRLHDADTFEHWKTVALDHVAFTRHLVLGF